MLSRSTLKAKLKHPRNSGDKKWGTVSSGSFGLKIGSRRRMPERILCCNAGFRVKELPGHIYPTTQNVKPTFRIKILSIFQNFRARPKVMNHFIYRAYLFSSSNMSCVENTASRVFYIQQGSTYSLISIQQTSINLNSLNQIFLLIQSRLNWHPYISMGLNGCQFDTKIGLLQIIRT